MVENNMNAPRAGPKWAPQVVVSLDERARVVNVNRSLAGTSFAAIIADSANDLHSQLHDSCDGNCRFGQMWVTAWDTLDRRGSIEWEVDDEKTRQVLRLNLSILPAPNGVATERRQKHRLLIITDITKHRREHETLLQQQQSLVKLLMDQGADADDGTQREFDESGDTGNRFMAAVVKQERTFSRQLILAQEVERKRIAAELHDGIAQTIGVVKYKVESCAAQLEEQNPDLDLSMMKGVVADFRYLVDEIRRISNNLAPSMLEDFGLQVALEWLCKEFRAQNRNLQVDCTVHIDEMETPELVKIAIYRVAQEALNNVSKHAAATRVNVVLRTAEDGVHLEIADDGAGFEAREDATEPSARSGFGLRSMRERVEATGGQFSVASGSSDGTLINADWSEADLDAIR